MEMAKKMLKSYQGIPLAIIVLLGLLVTRTTLEEWQAMLNHIISHHMGKVHQQPYEKVIGLCYYDLPYYLKNCFLHLGNVPEDFEILVSKLCYMCS